MFIHLRFHSELFYACLISVSCVVVHLTTGLLDDFQNFIFTIISNEANFHTSPVCDEVMGVVISCEIPAWGEIAKLKFNIFNRKFFPFDSLLVKSLNCNSLYTL